MNDTQRPADDGLKDGIIGMMQEQGPPHSSSDVIPLASAGEEIPMEMEVAMRLEPNSSATIVKTSPVDEGFPPDMGTPPQDELDDQEQRETSPDSTIFFDAISYLNAIKTASPTVYYEFIDIMKDNRNQTIDTPSVIQRVSSLFAEFPLLLEGLNVFLPAEYYVECSVDRDTNGITTPE